jgi:hypothetical protein
MEYATTQSERLALIKKIAERRNKMAKIKAKSSKVYETINYKTGPKKIEIPKDNDNIYAYTDASKYAKEYYGEVMYETTKYDNDWD